MFKKILLLSLLCTFTACSLSNSDEIRDPGTLSRNDFVEISYKMKPHIKKAKDSLPYAKNRYMKGLQNGEKLYVTIKLYDPDKSFEQVELLVADWYNNSLLGKITSQLYVLQRYNQGEMVNFNEDAIIDWTLINADGKVEGGYVRKFLNGCGKIRH